jgi:hypothetical protein
LHQPRKSVGHGVRCDEVAGAMIRSGEKILLSTKR